MGKGLAFQKRLGTRFRQKRSKKNLF
ncbi:hypothetical protein LOS23_07585 [Enterococcus faecium]|nr:hypothetical protein [Enterococcus faecium]